MLGVCLGTLPVWGQYGGGSGEPNEPYLIYDADQLQAVGANSADWDKHFRLMADIDLSGYPGSSFNQIGYYDAGGDIYKPFSGVFDGNGYTISNFNFDSPTEVLVGLFGCVDGAEAVVKNVGLEDPNVVGYYGVAALVGQMAGGTIEGCYVKGGQVTGDIYTGALVGLNYSGTISTCYNQTKVTGTTITGGLIGYNEEGQLYHCYQAGEVSGTDLIGTVIGYDELGTFDNSLWNNEINGSTPAVGNISTPTGLIAESTTNMHQETTYTAANWDFDTLPNWRMPNDPNYPQIWWEKYSRGTGESNNPYQIATAKHLLQMSDHPQDWGKHFIMTADIDLADYTFTTALISPDIDKSDGGHQGETFSGIFDGDNFIIYNLKVISTDSSHLGMFGHIEKDSKIKNLKLMDPNIIGDTYVSALVGYSNGLIENCNINGYVSGYRYIGGVCAINNGEISGCVIEGELGSHNATSYAIGGIAGITWGTIIESYSSCNIIVGNHSSGVGGVAGSNDGEIRNCYSVCSVTSGDKSRSIGGLVGANKNYYGEITKCFTLGTVVVGDDSSEVGGLVGLNDNRMSECYAKNTVSGGEDGESFGGLVGRSNGYISECYASGDVSGNDSSRYLGGLVGYGASSNIKNSYATGDVVGHGVSGALGGLVGQLGTAGDIVNCYSIGSVNGGASGGMLGRNGFPTIPYTSGLIKNCFWDIETSGLDVSDGDEIGLPTSKMKEMSTFGLNGWAGDVWVINEPNDYPKLSWENTEGDFIVVPDVVYDGAGSGTEGDPFQVSNASQLASIGFRSILWDKFFMLVNDIDMKDEDFLKIGHNSVCSFTGSFDGNGYSIKNLVINDSDKNNIGFVGYSELNAKIKSLNLRNIEITGHDKVGGIIGRSGDDSIIENCSVDGFISGVNYVGGLVGDGANQTKNSSSKCTIQGTKYVGGLFGKHSGGIVNSYSDCNIIGGNYVGGITGSGVYSNINNSYSSSSLQGSIVIGGLVGRCFNTNITNSYACGPFEGVRELGGLIGTTFGDNVISYSFWDIENGGPDNDWGIGLPTEQMQEPNAFLSVGWDFVGETANGVEDVWKICEGLNYPRLSWQEGVLGDFGCPYGVGLEDLGHLLDWWLEDNCAVRGDCAGADVDGSGQVDLRDFSIVGQNWLDDR